MSLIKKNLEIFLMNLPNKRVQICRKLNSLTLKVNSGLNEVRENLKNLKDLGKQVLKDDSQFTNFLDSALKIPENSN